MNKVETNFNFIEMEHNILNFWEKEKCFKRLQEKNKDGKLFRFLDGPITANNPMGIHHAWGRTLKDIFHRYKGMNGYTSHYRNGFDGQGLWIEVEVEKELGFKNKKDIEKYGLENFTKKCMERVKKYSEIITEQSKRLGQWMDWDNSYYTNTEENITSIWYFLKKCHERGMIKQSFRPMPWCPRCGTSLSEHEMSGSYKQLVHKAVFFKLPLKGTDCKAVVWTTTPWTLSSNVALAVNPEFDYAKVKVKSDDKYLILAKNAIKVLGDDKLEVLEIFKGDKLVGLEYETCFEEFEKQKNIEHRVVAWKDVSNDEGTGIVHIAPGCGLEDFELGKREGLDIIIPIDDSGIIIDGFGFMTGKSTKEVAEFVFDELEKRNKLYKVEEHEHSYPVCWRCKHEVVFKAVKEWHIDSDVIRDELIEASRKVKWTPEFAGKRMEDWLNNMGNWAISRKRFYGLPLPIYPCEECGEITVVGSKDELRNLAGSVVDELPDLHRPWIDRVQIKCPHCGKMVKRITDVGDCWLDAGIAPFSTLKYFTDKEYWKKYFPAEWVTEMKEQIRLWFYAQLFMSVVLEGKAPYESVLTYSAVVKEDGGKFSKSGYMIKFDEAAERIGADPARYLYAGAPTNNDVRFGYNLGDEARRKLLNFWNIYVFFNTYAILDMPNLKDYKLNEKILQKSDMWLLAKLNQFIENATKYMENYNTPSLVKEFELLVDDISNFYVRINRKRFWKDDDDDDDDKTLVYYLLYTTIKKVCQIMAPIIPFMTEEIWQNMVRTFEPDEEISIHLTRYPLVNEKYKNNDIINEVEETRKIINLGLMLRNSKQLKIKQPLSKMYIVSNNNMDNLIKNYANIIKDELNIKEIEIIESAESLNDQYLTVNFKEAGKLLKSRIQEFKEKIASLDENEMNKLVKMYNDKNEQSIKVDGFEEVPKNAFLLNEKPKDNIALISEVSYTVALDITLDENLIIEGLERELTRTIQVLRKEAGFKIEQRIELGMETKGKLLSKVIEKYIDNIKVETLAIKFNNEVLKEYDIEQEDSFNGESIKISLKGL